MAVTKCLDDYATIFDRKMCINAVSKDYKAIIKRIDVVEQKCEKPECRTLKTMHSLKMGAVISNDPCDSKLGKLLTGTIVVGKLATAFDQDGMHRGVHAGDFIWKTASFTIEGRLSGVTNAGTHRAPVFKACQRCTAPGFMEGRICGQVVDTTKPELKGCQLVGTYRISFDPTQTGPDGAGMGTIEAVLACSCG